MKASNDGAVNKMIMWLLVRKWVKKIEANPDSEEVIQMAAQTGNLRKLKAFKESK